MKFLRIIGMAALMVALLPQMAQASVGAVPPPQQNWEFHGLFGRFDDASLKRGAQVAVEVCMGCHSIKYIKFDYLRQFGYSETEVKQLAETQGMTKTDYMVSAMDDESAKDSFGVIPPDLSLMTKARKGYEDYTYGILTGYLNDEESALIEEAMEDETLSDSEIKKIAVALHLDASHPEEVQHVIDRINNGENFNKYFPGHFFAMPQPMTDGAIEYLDGRESSLKQMSRDVTAFLAWASEPAQVERKALAPKVLLYLLVLTVMLYALKRRIWARVH
ncbi:MAG: hypothetical protein HQL52_06845 [Magnetococcales bacterium]|nr:hypothetical protein [Magnetococcales bacterium]